MKKREVVTHVAEVILANKNILTPLELADKVLGMPGVAVVDREAEFEIIKRGSPVVSKKLQAMLKKAGWVKELK